MAAPGSGGAVRLVRDLRPDIVLLDIGMPGGGIEAALLAHDRFRAD